MKCNKPYSDLGITLFDEEIFRTDDKHYGKKNIGQQHVLYMLNRTQSMFDYEDLPETIPQRNLEIMLQLNGNVFWTMVDGKHYVFTGGLGGEPDVYYEPTIYTVANPALNFSKNLKIDEDGVLIRSDSYGVGLLPMFQRYAALMTENDITMRVADICSRIPFMISATDDKTEKSAKVFIQHIINGELDVISDNPFFEGLKVNPTAQDNSIRITDLIEYQQYLKAAWFNELGINANYNMKRESISPDEAQLNDDALLPYVDDMLETRKLGIEKVNEMYGLNIKVTLASSWLKEQMQQLTPGVDFDSDNDEHINEFTEDPEDVQNNAPEDPEEVTPDDETQNNAPEDPEEIPDIETELEDIKEDLQEIKEDIQEGDDDAATE